MADKQSLILILQEFMENEARSGSMDLTLSKSLTLGKAQVNLALLSLNRDCRMYNSAVCLWDVGRQRCDRGNCWRDERH